MSAQGGRRGTSGVVGAAIFGVLMWGASAQAALPATGGSLRTIDLVGTSADCGTSGGTSVALVPGGRVGLDQDQFPVLLLTTCLASGNTTTAKAKRSTLYLIDPAITPSSLGRVPKTITTTTPASPGFAAVVYRANKGDVLLCHSDGSLYSAKMGDFTTVSTSLLFKPATSCTAVAWDASDKTIFMSNGSQILHVSSTGTVQGTISAATIPSCTTVRGLASVGGVLLVTCDGNPTFVRRLDKTSTSGTPLPTDPTITFDASPLVDLECDPKTFGLANGEVNALWSKNPAGNQVRAFRVPAGTCGLPPTSTVLEPAKCPVTLAADSKYWTDDDRFNGAPKDSDGDGLWDCWEDKFLWTDLNPGIDFNNSAIALTTRPLPTADRDLMLCANVVTGVAVASNGTATATFGQECTDPNVKDIWVELDFMEDNTVCGPGPDGIVGTADDIFCNSHRPDPVALLNVWNAFANAPVDNPQPGGSGPKGIRLHFQQDEKIPHNNNIALEPCTSAASGSPGAVDFDTLKSTYFGTPSESGATLDAKSFAFRYMIFAHNLVGTTASGCAERPGNDAVISLASFSNPLALHDNGTTAEQGGVVMHELGHNLGLGHGGGDDNNCKSNYLSVMNYTFIFPDYVNLRPLDYSRAKLDDLTKSALSEPLGIGPEQSPVYLNGTKTVYLPVGALTPFVKTLAVDPVSNRAPIDWNNLNGATETGVNAPDINKLTSAGCPGSGTVLTGHNDWANLQYNGRAALDFVFDKTAEAEGNSWLAADSDGDGQPDALACGGTECVIDILPQENPNVVNVSQNSNIRVAWINTPTFNAPLELDTTRAVTLNDQQCFPSANVGSNPNVQDVNGDGRPDLVFRCPAAGLQFGTNLAVLAGFTKSGHPARGRGFVTAIGPLFTH